MKPQDAVTTDRYKGFVNTKCEFYPCHTGVKNPDENFNCLFCYCPLAYLECPGPYEVFTGPDGIRRKDCSACKLNHDGLERSWKFIQRWVADPIPWSGEEQTAQRMRQAQHVEHPRRKT